MAASHIHTPGPRITEIAESSSGGSRFMGMLSDKADGKSAVGSTIADGKSAVGNAIVDGKPGAPLAIVDGSVGESDSHPDGTQPSEKPAGATQSSAAMSIMERIARARIAQLEERKDEKAARRKEEKEAKTKALAGGKLAKACI